MPKVYAALILRGKKKLADVTAHLRDEVEALLKEPAANE